MASLLDGSPTMRGLGSSVIGTIVALLVLGLAAAAVAVGWRVGTTRSPI